MLDRVGIYEKAKFMTQREFSEFVSAVMGELWQEEDREFTFPIGADQEITLALEPNGCVGLYTIVYQSKSDEEIPAWMYREVALANYGCAATHGGALGIHTQTGGVLYTRILTFVDGVELEKLLEQAAAFVEMALHWNRRLAQRVDEERLDNLMDEVPASSDETPESSQSLDEAYMKIFTRRA